MPHGMLLGIPQGLMAGNERGDGEDMPVDVQAAMAFVRLCNKYTTIVPVVVGGELDQDCECFEQELPVQQEAAFSMACQSLVAYFSHAAKERANGKDPGKKVEPEDIKNPPDGFYRGFSTADA